MLRVAEHYAGSDTGRQRRANEDSLLARSPLFVVADGMGGAQAGEVASRIAVEAFEAGLEDSAAPEAALASLAMAANTRIHELSQEHAEQAGMGTTLTAIYVGEEEVTIAHVGDSRAYYFRDGELHRLTDDHSLVDELIRQGRLTPEEAADHPQRSVITRALGPEGTVEVDTRSFRARDGDIYLICSDGLTTMVSEEQIASVLLAHPNLREAGEGLIAVANEAGGRDNITVVLLRLEELRPATPTDPAATVVPATSDPAATGAAATGATAATIGPGVPAPGSPAATGVPAPGSPPATGSPATDPRPTATGAPTAPGGSSVALATRAAHAPDAVQAAGQAVTPRRPRRRAESRPPGRRRPLLRRLRRVSTIAVLLVTLAFLGSAAYLALQSIYFVGTNSRGLVTLYNGLPYRLPFGIALYTTTYVSGVSAATIPPERRRAVLDNSLRSESQAADLIRSLELGQPE